MQTGDDTFVAVAVVPLGPPVDEVATALHVAFGGADDLVASDPPLMHVMAVR